MSLATHTGRQDGFVENLYTHILGQKLNIASVSTIDAENMRVFNSYFQFLFESVSDKLYEEMVKYLFKIVLDWLPGV